ncbi:MAG: MoxR family ATPase [Planctomycetia bacterium]|nr:MoxR family ATPase [Planctomycetia bacterium]
MSQEASLSEEVVRRSSAQLAKLRTEIARVVVGQNAMVSRLLVGVLARGHVLLEGVPGLAKTTAIKSLTAALDAKFQRVQFTPDILPADLIGTMIYTPSSGSFQTRKGPIFANFVLADEINRAPSKVQSALLEAMQERQVTIGETTWRLQEPFLVLATQNPIEQEGTYPLPEAQVDRFMLKIKLDYPSMEEEQLIFDRGMDNFSDQPQPVLTTDDVLQLQKVVDQIYLDPSVRDYIVHLTRATRSPEQYRLPEFNRFIQFGASPRASLCIGKGAKALALLAGRNYVTPQDVKDIALDAMRHRVVLTYEAEAEEISADDVIKKILDVVPTP